MVPSDITEMKQKIAEYERLDQELSGYTKLIYKLANVGVRTTVTVGVHDERREFRLSKAQTEKLAELLKGFQNDVTTEMEQM